MTMERGPCPAPQNRIVAETHDGITIIDQHAAHERLVMEQMKGHCW